MFEIGLWELVVIAVVALIVIGPERLPGVARTTGHWFGRAKRMVASVRDDIEREIKAEELKKIMERQAQSTGLHEIIEEGRYTLKGLEEEIAVTGAAGQTDPEKVPVKAESSDVPSANTDPIALTGNDSAPGGLPAQGRADTAG